MAIAMDIDRGRRSRRWGRSIWALVAAVGLLPLAAIWVMLATHPDENIVLSRNEVFRTPAGQRSWRGTFWNQTDSLYTNLDAVILFLDGDGKPLGQARGSAPRLDPGETFHLQAPLPAGATQIQMYQLRWTTGEVSEVLGLWRAWPFGYVQASECGDLRLKTGSCTPMREAV